MHNHVICHLLQTSLTRSVGDSLTNELLKEDLLEGLCTRALLSTDDNVSSLCGKVLSHLLAQGGRKAVQSMAPWQLYVEVRPNPVTINVLPFKQTGPFALK